MNIYEILDELKINYNQIEHNAIYTVEDAQKENITSKIEGLECKNLLLKDTKHNYYLVLLKANKKANLKVISSILNTSRLSFASEEALDNLLKLSKGSVTPLGIINDTNNRVTLLIDSELKNKYILVHPNTNTRTISICEKDLIKIINYTKHSYYYI